jgi:hypothetical protein
MKSFSAEHSTFNKFGDGEGVTPRRDCEYSDTHHCSELQGR